MVRKTKGGKEIIDIDYDEAAQIVTASTSANVMQVQAMGRISRASLEESTQRALTTHQDVKIPDGPIVIDKDLLQEIYNQLAFTGEDRGYSYSIELCNKLDSLYPYLSC